MHQDTKTVSINPVEPGNDAVELSSSSLGNSLKKDGETEGVGPDQVDIEAQGNAATKPKDTKATAEEYLDPTKYQKLFLFTLYGQNSTKDANVEDTKKKLEEFDAQLDHKNKKEHINVYEKPGSDESYKAMIQTYNRTHYSKKSEESSSDSEKEFNPSLPVCCGFSTGWMSFSSKSKSDGADEKLGLGVSLYFKQLKSLVILYLVLSFVSIPAFTLYYFGGKQQATFQDSKAFMSTFTLGNVGQSVSECTIANRTSPLEIYCPFGYILQYDFYVAADMTKNECNGKNPASLMTDYNEACNFTSDPGQIAKFSEQCEGKKNCTFQVEWDKFPSVANCGAQENSAVMVTQCSEGGIEVPGFGVF